jgi:hypothetical protein
VSTDLSEDTKLSCHWGSGNTVNSDSPNIGNHTVFVLGIDGKPLTPTTPAKARKLLKGGKAKKVWSKFNTFGIQMLEQTRTETPKTTLGYDPGGKFEGLSVVCGRENNLSNKLDLPDKSNIVRKMEERSRLRHNRHYRNCRRRPARFNNRNRKGYIAPSQMVIVCSRLKILREYLRIYPIQNVAMEDVRFNHSKYRYGKYFSTVEIGKNIIRQFFRDNNVNLFEYQGYETKEFRENYGYKKTSSKKVDSFNSHCSDSLALAAEVNCGDYVKPGLFLVVDDKYRCVKRRLHDTQYNKDGIREKYSCGNVKGIKKGRMIGTKNGNIGQLCGKDNEKYKYYNNKDKRLATVKIIWIENQFKIKKVEVAHSATGQAHVVPCA